MHRNRRTSGPPRGDREVVLGAVGYDTHITRKENWFDANGPAISLEDWTALVNSDPEMQLDGLAEVATDDKKMFRLKMPGLSLWTSYSQSGKNGNQAWFALYGGNIVVKNSDSEILRKMYVIAQRLAARVQGDEGEIYGPDGEPT
jgi:hypothetical protein